MGSQWRRARFAAVIAALVGAVAACSTASSAPPPLPRPSGPLAPPLAPTVLPPPDTCISLSSLPACNGGWCFVDPIGGGVAVTGVHGLAPDDAWIAADGLLHWDGKALVPVPLGGGYRAYAVFEAAPNEIWIGATLPDRTNVIARVHDGKPEYVRNTPPLGASFAGSGPSDVWMTAGVQLLHWDGAELTERPAPQSSVRRIAVAHGAVWATHQETIGPNFIDSLHRWNGAGWDLADSAIFAGSSLAAFDGDEAWTAFGGDARRNDGHVLSLDPLAGNEFRAISGASGSDFWITGSVDDPLKLGTMPTLFHSNGEALLAVDYTGGSLPTAMWIGGPDWGFIGEDRGGLLVRSGGGFVSVTPKPLPKYGLMRVGGTGPGDIYLSGSTAGAGGELRHWDGCRWSPAEASVPGAAGAIVGIGNEVWISGAGSRTGGFVMHRGPSGWSSFTPPNGAGYGSIWAAAPNDVWFAGSGFMHWDGAAFTTSPLPAGLPPSPDLSSLTGTAPDDIWAVEYGTPSEVFHYDGKAWTLVPALSFDGMRAVAKNDVWGVGFSGVFHFDGATWEKVSTERLSRVIWSSGSDDVWFGESGHWDGKVLVKTDVFDDSEDLWGDGQHIWSVGGGVRVR